MFNEKKYMKKYWTRNKNKLLKQHREWSKNNPGKAREYSQRWDKTNPEYKKQWYQDNKEKTIKRTKQWIKNNREKVRLNFRQWKIKKRRIDLKLNINEKIRRAISISLKENKNGRHWENLVNYTLNDLIKRLEITMPKGYNWQDYLNGDLQIDHIIPIRAFEFKTPEDEEFKECWSLYNLRLLSSDENRLKHDTIDNPILLGLLIKVKVKKSKKKGVDK